MFEDCNKHVCYAFDHVQEAFSRTTPEYLIKKTQTTKITYPLGIDLDNSNDESWTLIISYENFEDLEFQIGALPAISIKGVKVEDEIPLTGFANVKVKYSKIGQDGTAFFHQFTFQPTKAGDSLIDSLKLYENEKYPIKLIFKGSTPFTHADAKDGIEFLKKGCDDGYFVFNRENSRPKVEHNKLSCPNDKPEHTVIFLDSKMLDGNILYCSKKGWRDANGNLIKVYKEEQAFCSTLCQDAAMKIINAVDSAGEEVKPKKDSDKFDYKCLQGKASIRINDKFYDNVKCESNKWTGDGEDIKLEYSEEKKLESYQFDAKCFGVFMFLKDNCDSETLKKTGCQQPKIINNEELKCDDGFALTYGNKIYQSLKIVKGAWKDQDGKDVENADEQKKPQCLSKCSREHVKMLGGELSEAADYNWDQATNTGTLSCIDKTNILIADFEGSAKSYFTDWTCDAKTEWKIKTGTEKKDLKSITDPAKFVVNAHCFKACDDSKVVNACDDTETECKKNKYADHELSCEAHEVMFLVDAGSKSEQEKKPLVCSAEGWKAKGDTILKYDHKVNKDVKISVQCVQKCAKRFRTDDVGPEYDGSVMTCKGTKMISYTYPPNQAKTTLEDLTCDYRDGWKDKKGKVIDFASGYKFKATCVDSCTNAWLVDNCRTAGRSVCETASLKSDLIKCEKEGFVLNYRDPTNPLQTAALEYKEISCSKTMFENTPSDTTQTKISVARVDTDTKINVECISKCDKQFVKLDDEQTRVPTLDPGKPNSLTKTDTELKCTDPLHYTTLLIDQKPVYTNDKFVCDPEKGWSASDLNGGNVLHEGHLAASKVGCYDVCKDRFTVAAGKDSGDYIKPTYTEGTIKTISCGDKHTMSIGKEEYLRETLECKDKGYLRKSNNEEIFSFDNNDATKQFEMHCFSNCMKELVTPDKTHLVSQVDDKKMKCAKDEILQIETGENSVISRVFSEATCEPDKGWHGELAKADNSGTEDGKFVDFATNVRLKASCRKVCSDVANFIDDCEGDEKSKDKTCHETRPAAETTGLSHLLKCNEHYRLFMKYGEATEYEETGPSKCARTGWTNEKDEIINDMNFMNPDVKIEQEVHYKCKHKCHPEFVQNSCVTEGKDPKDVTCSNFIYDVENRKMYCKHPSEVLVFEYAADSSLPIASKESFSTKVVNATCSDDGWKTEDGIDIFKMTADNFHISARCEQMCHPALLTQTTGSISYELGGKLTCTEEHEKLVFADNDWHTDLVCSATGWIDATFNKNVATAARAKPLGQIDFVADTARTFKAECIHSKCINQDPNFDRCAKAALEGNEQKRECSKPDFESRKYYVSCEDPMRIVKAGFPETIVQVLLRCAANSAKDDTWRTWDETNHEYRDEFQDATPEEFICFAGECAQCEATLKNGTCGSSDVNCKAASFNKGSASFCSNYYCNGLGYRFGDAQSNYKYYNGSGRVTCMTPGTFKAPDLASTISAPIACVYQIPCVDYAPLNTTCAGLAVSCDEEGLKQNLTAASKYGASPIQSTEDHQLYYSTTGGPPWTNFDRLKCDKNGKWEAYDKSDAVTYLEEKTRVVWTESDPAGPKPSTTTPKPGICSFCALPPKKECDGCSTDAITTKEVNGTCTATTTNGHFVNEKKEKVEALKCKDEKTGVYVWRDGKGNEVKSLAVVADNPIIAGANPGMIAGIVIGVLCVIGGVAGLVVFMHVRKKKEAARLETLKSKGLETKNDSIIDQIEVDDPKTIRL